MSPRQLGCSCLRFPPTRNGAHVMCRYARPATLTNPLPRAFTAPLRRFLYRIPSRPTFIYAQLKSVAAPLCGAKICFARYARDRSENLKKVGGLLLRTAVGLPTVYVPNGILLTHTSRSPHGSPLLTDTAPEGLSGVADVLLLSGETLNG